jgi:hypothetical protein
VSTDGRGYQTFTLIWAERSIAVSHQVNWLRSGYWHIELRCADQLPVTQTGYRSIFVPQADFADETAIKDFVTRLLDEAAVSPAWQAYLVASRQLTLF